MQPHQNQAAIHPDHGQQLPRLSRRIMFALLLVAFSANAAVAIPLTEYRDRVKKAIEALDLLHETEDSLTQSQKNEFAATNIRSARAALPRAETVEWNGVEFKVDNSWLDDELKELEKLSLADVDRSAGLDRILERLQALAERLAEIDKSQTAPSLSRAESNERLNAILQRTQFARKPKEEAALSRLLRQLWKWLAGLFPKRSTLDESQAMTVSRAAQIFVLALALAAIAYVLWKFLPRVLRQSRTKKVRKPRGRVVLGEPLAPDQSAADLLAQAEALARAGDLRGAIRRGYIALLVELADRKIISLAQHKTNRDYLGAVREIQGLHRKMEALTNNFEQHCYGLTPAVDSDWAAFRAGYKEVSSFEF